MTDYRILQSYVIDFTVAYVAFCSLLLVRLFENFPLTIVSYCVIIGIVALVIGKNAMNRANWRNESRKRRKGKTYYENR